MKMKLTHTNTNDFTTRLNEASAAPIAASDRSASTEKRGRYEAELKDYCWKLQRDEPTDLSTALLLSELDRLLDRCGKLASPEREAHFVEEVCRMGKRFNLAA